MAGNDNLSIGFSTLYSGGHVNDIVTSVILNFPFFSLASFSA